MAPISLINVSLGCLLVFASTSLGALMLLFVRRVKEENYDLLLAFAAGVMGYTSIEMVFQSYVGGGLASAAVGFAVGVGVLTAAERLLPHIHPEEFRKRSRLKTTLLVGAVAIHNIPEGFAVGAAFAKSSALGWFVAVSIAIQDFPEGLLIAAPLFAYGTPLGTAILWGVMSGASEALAGMASHVFLEYVTALTPVALGFSAGAMTHVILVELLPDVFRDKGKRAAAAAIISGSFVGTFLLGRLFTF